VFALDFSPVSADTNVVAGIVKYSKVVTAVDNFSVEKTAPGTYKLTFPVGGQAPSIAVTPFSPVVEAQVVVKNFWSNNSESGVTVISTFTGDHSGVGNGSFSFVAVWP
jgi:hypothetical protein